MPSGKATTVDKWAEYQKPSAAKATAFMAQPKNAESLTTLAETQKMRESSAKLSRRTRSSRHHGPTRSSAV